MREDIKAVRHTATLGALLIVSCVASISAGAQTQGQVHDRGARFSVKRYVMNLGEIDLAQAEEKHFRVEGLPADREFILGINLELGDCAIEKSDMRIALEMTDEHVNLRPAP